MRSDKLRAPNLKDTSVKVPVSSFRVFLNRSAYSFINVCASEDVTQILLPCLWWLMQKSSLFWLWAIVSLLFDTVSKYVHCEIDVTWQAIWQINSKLKKCFVLIILMWMIVSVSLRCLPHTTRNMSGKRCSNHAWRFIMCITKLSVCHCPCSRQFACLRHA